MAASILRTTTNMRIFPDVIRLARSSTIPVAIIYFSRKLRSNAMATREQQELFDRLKALIDRVYRPASETDGELLAQLR